jgi:hypothetical protein
MNSLFDIQASIYNDIKGQIYDFAVLPWGAPNLTTIIYHISPIVTLRMVYRWML